MVAALAGQTPAPPAPPAPGAAPVAAPVVAPAVAQHQVAVSSAAAGATVLARAAPVSVSVPSVGVRSPRLETLGLQDDGSLQVPVDDALAGWYEHAPTPGELGPAVIAGHVDSREGPAVFYRLAEVRPGAEVVVAREDGSRAVFVVERVEQHPKDDFPTAEVYGTTDHPALRLITCGGDFDASSGHYESNVVVFARLVAVR
ncbi:class F sortase [Quadrisphaera sp. DSM 44207]|uniref:class F sortase n=1 Tax=Quadrisphaera sp. DSM 44207 TaxID=1881057 RepID=UPI000888915D|nr:class F sortase [Quadrisphaera sp. DSM 44207]SDQ78006.1 Sortase family protein [Quadrisphaera sp. DSM 44207]